MSAELGSKNNSQKPSLSLTHLIIALLEETEFNSDDVNKLFSTVMTLIICFNDGGSLPGQGFPVIDPSGTDTKVATE